MIHATLTHPAGLSSTLIDRGLAALRATGATARADGGRLAITGVDLATARAALRPFEPQADILAWDRAPRLLVADMDSTMVTCECLDELADYAGLKSRVAAITERAMRGELDFAASLTHRVALLAGLPAATIEACLAERVRPTPGARTLIATLAAHGVPTILVTGGFTAFADPVAAMLGFTRVVANRLDVGNGHLTGRVLGPIIDAAAKRAALLEAAAPLGGAAHALAIGDGANDAPMLAAAGLGVAWRAKPAAAQAAAHRIAHGDLSQLIAPFGIDRARSTVLP